MASPRADIKWSVENLFFLSPDHGRVQVTNLFDEDNNEVSDPGVAAKCVALLPNGQFLASVCYPDEIVTGDVS